MNRHCPPHRRLGASDDFGGNRAQAFLAVFGKKVAQAAAHFFAGANHGMDIAHDLIWYADILADHLDQSFIWPARVIQFQNRDLQTFFVNILVVWCPAAPSHIRHVSDRAGKSHEFVSDEYWDDCRQIGQMPSPEPRVIADDDVVRR